MFQIIPSVIVLSDMEKEKKRKRYIRIHEQLKELLVKSDNQIARMSTIAAVLHHKIDYFFWTGFYLNVDGDLIVGSYQGPVACMKLEKNTGVCWAGFNEKKTIVVSDVEQFPGHIACDSRSRSEIVVPLMNKNNEIIGVLDVDSQDLNSFDEVDAEELEKIVQMIF